jgi:hypothetical protein
VTYDAAHHGAIELKRRFKSDLQWSENIGRLSQVKSSIRQTIDAFLASPSLRPKARYMNLESLFGKWKTLERQESQSGITGLILSLGALLGAWPSPRIQATLEATPVKQEVRWCQDNLPSSVQSQRRIAFSGQKT